MLVLGITLTLQVPKLSQACARTAFPRLASSRSMACRVASRHPSLVHPFTLYSHFRLNNDATMVLALLAGLMGPPTQVLRTLQPTSSTVSFTVSTRPVPLTVTARLRYYASILTRFLIGTCVLVVLWIRWSISYGESTNILLWIFGGPQTALLLKIVGAWGWHYIVPGALAMLFMVLRRGYTGSLPLMYLFLTLTDVIQKSP